MNHRLVLYRSWKWPKLLSDRRFLSSPIPWSILSAAIHFPLVPQKRNYCCFTAASLGEFICQLIHSTADVDPRLWSFRLLHASRWDANTLHGTGKQQHFYLSGCIRCHPASVCCSVPPTYSSPDHICPAACHADGTFQKRLLGNPSQFSKSINFLCVACLSTSPIFKNRGCSTIMITATGGIRGSTHSSLCPSSAQTWRG